MERLDQIIQSNIGTQLQVELKASKDIKSSDIPQEVRKILDVIFSELMSSKPSWRSSFKTQEEATAYKKTLGQAMYNAGINTAEKAKIGLEFALLDESDFMPSVGKFIKWCKDGHAQNLRQAEMLGTTKRIMDEKRMISSTTFEQRQKTAKSEIGKLLSIVKHRQISID